MELPPKLVGKEVVRRERGISKYPHGNVDRDPDALPVLGAFGEFIEVERRRSRNRIFILSGFFLLILILVVSAAVLVGMLFYERVQTDVQVVRKDMQQIQTQAQDRHDTTEAALLRLEQEARSLLDSINQHEEALASTRSAVDARKQDVEQELADMKQLVNLLEMENTALKQDVQHVTSRLPKLVTTMEELMMVVGNQPAAVGLGVAGAAIPEKAALPPSFAFPLLPVGTSRSFAWRLPIPE